MLQPLGLLAQRLVLARLRVDPGDLVEAEPEQVGLLVALARVAAPVGQVVLDRAPLRVPLAQLGEQLVVVGPGEPVERGALLARAQQPQLVGLAVHGDHLLADLAEHGDRDGAAADVRPRPALGGDRAGQQRGCRRRRARRRRRPPARRPPRRCARSAAAGPRPPPGRDRRAPVPASARPPNSSPRPVTTMVLPAPVSPVMTFMPRVSGSVVSSMTPSPVMRSSSSTARQ